jgi:LysM repeat protein
MRTAETRLINQCTYTPVVNSPEIGDDIPGFVAKQPFLKQNILAVVLDEPQKSQFLFDQLPDVDEKIKLAVEEMWKGDNASVAEILNEIDAEEIISFAMNVLEVERSLLQTARQDVEEVVVSVVEEEHSASVVTQVGRIVQEAEEAVASAVESDTEVAEEFRRELKDLQETINAIVLEQGTGESAVTEVRGEMVAAEEKMVSVAEDKGMSPDVVAQVRREMGTLQQSVAAVVGRVAITHAKVTTKLAESYPQSAAFLTALGLPATLRYSEDPLARHFSANYPEEVGTREVYDGDLEWLWEYAGMVEVYEGYFERLREEIGIAKVYEECLEWQEYLNRKKEQALQALLETMKVEPVGYLHLERLQFTPIGYERGELVYTLPLLPGETIRLSYREWSRTESEYTKLVATSLETAAEDALTEKSELSQSLRTEQQHSSAFNASVSTSGGFGPVNISTSVGYNSQNSDSRSREHTARHSREITKKASSRAKKEHKISFRVTTEYEVEEESYREIVNPLDRAVRWDFHRLMKKWRIDLFRYDVRLTYDIVIPEPGSYLLRKYILLKGLTDELAKPNPFDLAPTGIDDKNYTELAEQYGIYLEGPLDETVHIFARAENKYVESMPESGYDTLELSLPEGYEFESWEAHPCPHPGGYIFHIDPLEAENSSRLEAGYKLSNHYVWRYRYTFRGYLDGSWVTADEGETLTLDIYVTGKLSDRSFREWQMRCFEQLADAAKAQHESRQLRLRRLRDDLLGELSRDDALMLRKIEKEEIMKGVLRWVLGPAFSFYPLDLPPLSLDTSGQLEYYEESTALVHDTFEMPDPWARSVKKDFHTPMLRHGEIIRFLHHAIEWESVNYVMYPYFWTDDPRWDFKQFLYHDDYVHRSFLRAGAARVVLTLRPGYEKAFLSFMETGKLGELLSEGHSSYPYMTVADELKHMAGTSYPYTPSAADEYPVTYVVKPGDTLEEIAATFGVTVEAIVEANNIEDPDHIEVGQVLVIPNNLVDTWYEFTPTGALDVVEGTIISRHITYVVQPGDTLGEIAARFGVTVQAIVKANRIEDPDHIQVGQVLVIPTPDGE